MGEQCKQAKTPPQANPHDAPSRNMPNQDGMKIVNGDVRRPEARNIGSWNWTGHTAKAGLIAGCIAGHVAGHIERAANGVRVGNAPRVVNVARA